MKKLKLFLTDIDGVWTDGGMFYDESGLEFKKFNTSDSAGVLFLRLLNIHVSIITGENSQAVNRRAKKLGIDNCFIGIKNKVKVAESLLSKLNLNWDEVAYIGDDINDIELLNKVGLSACPSSAPIYIKEIVDWELNKKGGEGAFREFVETYIEKTCGINHVLELYSKSKVFEQ